MPLIQQESLRPWAMQILVNWEPELRYYERRLDILRALEDGAQLASFQVESNLIRAKLPHQLQFAVGADSVQVQAGIAAGTEDVTRLVELLVTTIRPRVVTRLHVVLQHVAPLSMDYDAARRRGAERLLAAPFADPVSDWAVLVDAALPSGNAVYKVEYGVVEASEIRPRLARTSGRLQAFGSGLVDLPDQLPPVALFVDSAWQATGRAPAPDLAHAVAGFVTLATVESHRVVEYLYERLI